MSSASVSAPSVQDKLLRPILIGGTLAGTFDLIVAFILLGPGNPRLIAGGLLGPQALHGGAGVWILGVLCHYSIAFSAAAIYCLSSRRLPFLKDHWFVCGLFFGIAVYLVMNLVVLPLSAWHYIGPYHYRDLLRSILIHMFIIGLPISFSLRKL